MFIKKIEILIIIIFKIIIIMTTPINSYRRNGKNYSYTINSVKYDRTILREQLPYLIEYNKNTKDYYIVNRDYEYMGYNSKLNPSVDDTPMDFLEYEELLKNPLYEPEEQIWFRIYLYNDDTSPLISKTDMINYIKKLNKEKETLNNRIGNFINIFPFINF
jgi:hypothetical protein